MSVGLRVIRFVRRDDTAEIVTVLHLDTTRVCFVFRLVLLLTFWVLTRDIHKGIRY